jgi:hypothetical protein
LRCHPVNAGTLRGAHTIQMNRDFAYADATDNQIRALNHIGVFDPPVDDDPEALPRMPEPRDNHADSADRARAFLHGQCSHCHQPQGSASAAFFDMRWDTDLADTSLCEVIVPGDSQGSHLWEMLDSGLMPPVGTYSPSPDQHVVADWIDSMSSCP